MGKCVRKERRECVPGENKQYIWKQYPGQRVRYNENQHCCSKHCLSYDFSFLSYLRADEANEAMKQKLKKPIMSIKSMGSTMPQVSGVHCTMCSLYSMFSFQPNKLRHNLCLDIRFNIYLSHTLSFLCFFLLILPQS